MNNGFKEQSKVIIFNYRVLLINLKRIMKRSESRIRVF